MVSLQIENDVLRIEVRGLHKLWAVKGHLEIPVSALRGVRRMERHEIKGWYKGWRVPGTHVPGVFVAGTYYLNGERHFWDVRDADRAIEVELAGMRYDRLFIEVEDREKAIELLSAAAGPKLPEI